MKNVAVILTIAVLSFATAEAEQKGMTWAKESHFDAEGVDLVACRAGNLNCDPINGDTKCSEELPVLCIKKSSAANPGVPDSGQFSKWASAHIATTQPVTGLAMANLYIADLICKSQFGKGWRMAEFHDGVGWGLKAFGNVREDTRFWVQINDQNGNCWGRSPGQQQRSIWGWSQCKDGVLWSTTASDEGGEFTSTTVSVGHCRGDWVTDPVVMKK